MVAHELEGPGPAVIGRWFVQTLSQVLLFIFIFLILLLFLLFMQERFLGNSVEIFTI